MKDVKHSGGKKGNGSDDEPPGERHIMIPAGTPWLA
jgi:hypothetical protein